MIFPKEVTERPLIPFMRKWFRTTSAIVMLLSNKTLQVGTCTTVANQHSVMLLSNKTLQVCTCTTCKPTLSYVTKQQIIAGESTHNCSLTNMLLNNHTLQENTCTVANQPFKHSLILTRPTPISRVRDIHNSR